MSGTTVLASAAGTYAHWGVIHISRTNLIIIGLMLLLFALAILVPFPAHRPDDEPGDRR